MTSEGFRTPLHCWIALHVSVWTALFLASNANVTVQDKDAECQIHIKVRRSTVYETSVGQNLRINCPLSFCNYPPPLVSWYKGGKDPVQLNISWSSNMEIEWRMEKQLEAVSVLVFRRVLGSDSDLYQCVGGNVRGHFIKVSVKDAAVVPNNTSYEETNNTSISSNGLTSLWMYMYCAAGVMGIVVIVTTISVLSMEGCKGKPKKEAQTEDQYRVIPMVEQPYPPPGLQSFPRGSPSAPPFGPSTRTKTLSSPTQRQEDHVYGKVENDREQQRRKTEEVAGSVVYAALNHQAGAKPVCRPQAVEETTEYASIRVS